jgi:L-threonylcarbamoyladenylate synthase
MTEATASPGIQQAAAALKSGKVVAYPTEAVFGLGCDPGNRAAFEHLFSLKQRPATQGVLLIAGDFEQLVPYVDMDKLPDEALERVLASWPGPHTWILPRAASVPPWVTGTHAGIALRMTAHLPAAQLCRAFGGALVSTSANIHGHPPARDAATARAMFGDELAFVLDDPVGGLDRPTSIRDALTGAIIREATPTTVDSTQIG